MRCFHLVGRTHPRSGGIAPFTLAVSLQKQAAAPGGEAAVGQEVARALRSSRVQERLQKPAIVALAVGGEHRGIEIRWKLAKLQLEGKNFTQAIELLREIHQAPGTTLRSKLVKISAAAHLSGLLDKENKLREADEVWGAVVNAVNESVGQGDAALLLDYVQALFPNNLVAARFYGILGYLRNSALRMIEIQLAQPGPRSETLLRKAVRRFVREFSDPRTALYLHEKFYPRQLAGDWSAEDFADYQVVVAEALEKAGFQARAAKLLEGYHFDRSATAAMRIATGEALMAYYIKTANKDDLIHVVQACLVQGRQF